MKKTLGIALAAISASAAAQQKGSVQTFDFENFRFHVYNTNDALGDASFIIEGADAMVTMEEPLFKDNVAEFDQLLKAIGKPVANVISDYHVGSQRAGVVMPKGMHAFTKGPVYSGMMAGFAKSFGSAIVPLLDITPTEVAFDKEDTLAGVSVLFRHGAASDFPAASIIIGGKVYYTHWAPAKAHVSPLQIGSRAAVDAEIEETRRELESGAELFVGGHGGVSSREAVEFKLTYLGTVKRLLDEQKTASGFASALKDAFPALAGEEGVGALAGALYKE
mgnify:FL=1